MSFVDPAVLDRRGGYRGSAPRDTPRTPEGNTSPADRETPALTLSDELAAVTDQHKAADLRATNLENDYLHAVSVEYALASEAGIAVTARRYHCENQPEVVKARKLWNIGMASERAYRLQWKALDKRIMAELGHQRFIREQT